jgi:hypothetical protein
MQSLSYSPQCNNKLTLRIIFTETYGDSGGWCWLDMYNKKGRPIISKLILFYYVVMWFFIILSCFFIFKVIAILREHSQNSLNKYLVRKYELLKWLPIMQTVTLIPSTINRIFNVVNKRPIFGLMVIQVIFETLQGWTLTIIFILLPEIKHILKTCIWRVFKGSNISKSEQAGINYIKTNDIEFLLDKEVKTGKYEVTSTTSL